MARFTESPRQHEHDTGRQHEHRSSQNMPRSQQYMAGAQRSVASARIPLFALYGALHLADACFPVDTLLLNHQSEDIRAAEYTARPLHAGVVVHHPFSGILVHPAVAPLRADGLHAPQHAYTRQQQTPELCALSGSTAALYCHAANPHIRPTSPQLIIPQHTAIPPEFLLPQPTNRKGAEAAANSPPALKRCLTTSTFASKFEK